MATGTNGIATRENANNIISGAYSSDLKRCVTYSSAINAGFTVSNADRYTGNTNRLVRYSDLSYSPKFISFSLQINISSNASLYNKGPITLNASEISLSLKKDGSSEELVYYSTYGPEDVVYDSGFRIYTVSFGLCSKEFTSSDAGNYTLRCSSSAASYLTPSTGFGIFGYLVFNASNFEQTINVNTSGDYLFTGKYTARMNGSL